MTGLAKPPLALMNTKQRYRLRLLERVAFYDIVETQMFWDWPKGAIISDQTQINLLEARDAPVERIEQRS